MHGGKLYKKKCFDADLRYPVGKIHEDQFVTYRLLFKENGIAVVPEPLYYYYQNPDGIMNSPWTPRRLDELDAMEEQIFFFKKYEYLQAYMLTCRTYISGLASQLLRLQKDNNSNFFKYKRHLHYKLRKHIRKNKKDLHMTPKSDTDVWIFETAHPVKMKIWWNIKALKRKLKN